MLGLTVSMGIQANQCLAATLHASVEIIVFPARIDISAARSWIQL